jgi:hypothetical protein
MIDRGNRKLPTELNINVDMEKRYELIECNVMFSRDRLIKKYNL